jgi:exosortase
MAESIPPPPSTARRDRVDLLFLGLLIGVFIAAYFPVWQGLVTVWSDSGDYSHGFFVVPLAIYVWWRNRAEFRHAPGAAAWFGLPVAALALGLYLLAHLTEILTLASLSLVLFLVGTIAFLFGWRGVRQSLFPLFLLLLMIPFPSQLYSELTIPLQLLVSKAAAAIAQWGGIPLVRDGNLIHLPQHTVEIIQACSGLRSLISLVALSAVLGYFTLKRNSLRFVLVLLALPAAICVNIVRVLIILIAFYNWQTDLTLEPIHTVLGLVVFIFALLLVSAARGVLVRWDR